MPGVNHLLRTPKVLAHGIKAGKDLLERILKFGLITCFL